MTSATVSSTAHPFKGLAPTFACSRGRQGGTVRLALSGELDISIDARLDEALDHAHELADGRLVILDWRDVTLLGAAPARTMVAADRRYRDAGGRTVVVHVPVAIDRHLRIMGLDRALEILDPASPIVTTAGERPYHLGTSPSDVTVTVAGDVSPWTIIAIQRQALAATDHGHSSVLVDLQDAKCRHPFVDVMLAAALDRLASRLEGFSVTGAGR